MKKKDLLELLQMINARVEAVQRTAELLTQLALVVDCRSLLIVHQTAEELNFILESETCGIEKLLSIINEV